MPSRHITSQSFDDILSDLGDDPAIPDPHGIRKPPSQQSAPPQSQGQSNTRLFKDPLIKLQIPNSAQKIGALIALLFGIFLALTLGVFIAFKALHQTPQGTQEELQKLMPELKKEMALMRNEFHQDQDNLYTVLDDIKASIHLLLTKKSEIKASSKLKAPPTKWN